MEDSIMDHNYSPVIAISSVRTVHRDPHRALCTTDYALLPICTTL